jgi:[acyl-carrier-protein] S-malonyltransferase
MRYAMIFPGQGSQAVGMGADLVQSHAEARQVFEAADATLGYSLSELAFQGPLEKLTETRHAQPALLVHSIAVLRVLQSRGITPSIVAGHSLGEYSALVAAGVLQFEAALQLVRRRGELMFESGLRQPGAMAAVVGLNEEALQKVCADVAHLGVCDLANVNAPDQIVISGAVEAVEAAMPLLQEAGARVVKRLNVSGAFHSALMRQPAADFAVHLRETEFQDATLPVVANVSGSSETRGAQLRQLLEKQIASPVRWAASMRTLRQAWQGGVLEVGSGSVLKGLLRRIDRAASCTAVGDAPSLEKLLEKSLPSEASEG